jgi:hypothetical protein
MKRLLNLYLLVAFCFSQLYTYPVFAQTTNLPAPTQMINVSPKYSTPILSGIKIDPKNPLNITFIIDGADQSDVSKAEAAMLIRYFLAGLTIPQSDLWVNLSPYEQNRIVPQSLSQTDLGNEMLSQDYFLKQISASLTYPESELGKKYWAAIAENRISNARLNGQSSFNKIWIMPNSAQVLEHKDTAVITKADLKVMMESDYLAIQKNTVGAIHESPANNNAFKTQILPIIENEINNGKNFAQLRQVYRSLVLATWFKKKFQESFYKNYINQKKTNGITTDDKAAKDKVYALYCEAFQKGVYNYTKKETQGMRVTKRTYFSGGVALGTTGEVITSTPATDAQVQAVMPAHGTIVETAPAAVHPQIPIAQFYGALGSYGATSLDPEVYENASHVINSAVNEDPRLTQLAMDGLSTAITSPRHQDINHFTAAVTTMMMICDTQPKFGTQLIDALVTVLYKSNLTGKFYVLAASAIASHAIGDKQLREFAIDSLKGANKRKFKGPAAYIRKQEILRALAVLEGHISISELGKRAAMANRAPFNPNSAPAQRRSIVKYDLPKASKGNPIHLDTAQLSAFRAMLAKLARPIAAEELSIEALLATLPENAQAMRNAVETLLEKMMTAMDMKTIDINKIIKDNSLTEDEGVALAILLHPGQGVLEWADAKIYKAWLKYYIKRGDALSISQIIDNRPQVINQDTITYLKSVLKTPGLHSNYYIGSAEAVESIAKNHSTLMSQDTIAALETVLKTSGLDSDAYYRAASAIETIAEERPDLRSQDTTTILISVLKMPNLDTNAYWSTANAILAIAGDNLELLTQAAVTAIENQMKASATNSGAIRKIAAKRPDLLSENTVTTLEAVLMQSNHSLYAYAGAITAIRIIAEKRPELLNKNTIPALYNVFTIPKLSGTWEDESYSHVLRDSNRTVYDDAARAIREIGEKLTASGPQAMSALEDALKIPRFHHYPCVVDEIMPLARKKPDLVNRSTIKALSTILSSPARNTNAQDRGYDAARDAIVELSATHDELARYALTILGPMLTTPGLHDYTYSLSTIEQIGKQRLKSAQQAIAVIRAVFINPAFNSYSYSNAISAIKTIFEGQPASLSQADVDTLQGILKLYEERRRLSLVPPGKLIVLEEEPDAQTGDMYPKRTGHAQDDNYDKAQERITIIDGELEKLYEKIKSGEVYLSSVHLAKFRAMIADSAKSQGKIRLDAYKLLDTLPENAKAMRQAVWELWGHMHAMELGDSSDINIDPICEHNNLSADEQVALVLLQSPGQGGGQKLVGLISDAVLTQRVKALLGKGDIDTIVNIVAKDDSKRGLVSRICQQALDDPQNHGEPAGSNMVADTAYAVIQRLSLGQEVSSAPSTTGGIDVRGLKVGVAANSIPAEFPGVDAQFFQNYNLKITRMEKI